MTQVSTDMQQFLSGRVFSVEEDLEIFNCFPFPVTIADYHPDRQGFVWGNMECLKVFGKNSLEELLAWDFYKVSEGVRRMHDEYYRTVQKSFPAARVATLLFMVPASDEAGAEAVCGSYMLDRASSMAMLFLQEDQSLIKQNTLARSHFQKVTGRLTGAATLREVVEAVEGEGEEATTALLHRVLGMCVGEEPVEVEGVAKFNSVTEETAREMYIKFKFEATLDPRPGANERVAILVSGQDITDSVRLLRAEAAARQQEHLFSAVSHELRTPLNGILGLSESLLVDEELSPMVADTLRIIYDSGQRLSCLVNDILDAAALKHRGLTLKSETVDMAHVVSTVCDMTATLAKPSVQLRNEMTPLPLVQGDSGRLIQVMTNLVGNALKFTLQGSVTVLGYATEDSVIVDVRDTGIGIPAAKLDAVFDAFEQVDMTATRQFEGTGLGLSIAKSMAEAHGGDIRVSSSTRTDTHGSCFSLILPRNQPPGVTADETTLVQGRNVEENGTDVTDSLKRTASLPVNRNWALSPSNKLITSSFGRKQPVIFQLDSTDENPTATAQRRGGRGSERDEEGGRAMEGEWERGREGERGSKGGAEGERRGEEKKELGRGGGGGGGDGGGQHGGRGEGQEGEEEGRGGGKGGEGEEGERGGSGGGSGGNEKTREGETREDKDTRDKDTRGKDTREAEQGRRGADSLHSEAKSSTTFVIHDETGDQDLIDRAARSVVVLPLPSPSSRTRRTLATVLGSFGALKSEIEVRATARGTLVTVAEYESEEVVQVAVRQLDGARYRGATLRVMPLLPDMVRA